MCLKSRNQVIFSLRDIHKIFQTFFAIFFFHPRRSLIQKGLQKKCVPSTLIEIRKSCLVPRRNWISLVFLLIKSAG